MDEASSVLTELAQALADAGPALEPPGYDDVLISVTESVRRKLDAAACSIAVFDAEAEELVFVAATGAGADQIVGHRMRGATGVAGWVLASGQSIWVRDVAQDPRFAADVAAATGYVPSAIYAIPLLADDDPVGVLEVLDPTVTADMESDGLLEIYAGQASAALQAAAVFRDLGRTILSQLEAIVPGNEGIARAAAAARSVTRKSGGQLAELASIFAELRRLGPDERATAQRLLVDLLMYTTKVRPPV